ncbi:2'-5' RNA ligase family protein [Oryzihumus leptocrescens]|uniref:2'-5' RNA ligase n=1 Tax=Oryzihumus leptocrescens TaxID=297536 RepID=A0A542ZEZ4_9MICO|nr:2'-5' RNA ligase family protein [Oryzihumus leptocrescens]TQL58916.1 2'-5' RNA ligase [Oryzihumus leptocrescens]
MSDPTTDPYADHVEMANHWWWRPGWKVGTRFYAWHITLDGQDELHDLIDQYQEALKPFPTLDSIPREWRHITLQGLGHVEEVSDAQRDEAVEAVAARLRALPTIETTFDRSVIFREAIALKPSNPGAFAHLRNEVRAGIADAWGNTPEKPEGFRAHISVAYSNGVKSGAAIRRTLDTNARPPVAANFGEVSLIRMHRDREMYEWATEAEVSLGSSHQL